MKRRLLIIALFLLLGAMVNVAVAWISAVTINVYDAPDKQTESNDSGDIWTRATQIDRFSVTLIFVERTRIVPPAMSVSKSAQGDPQSLIPSWTGFRDPSPEMLAATDAFEERHTSVSRGWPMRSMCWDHTKLSTQLSEQPIQHGWTTPLPVWRFTDGFLTWEIPRVIPLRPIWPHFAIDTVFNAMLAWTMFVGPFALRRWRRRRRGCCVKCGYDLRGTGGVRCPECGLEIGS